MKSLPTVLRFLTLTVLAWGLIVIAVMSLCSSAVIATGITTTLHVIDVQVATTFGAGVRQ